MIRIIGTYDEATSAHRLELHGHAQYDPGRDIVCAAASCLMQSLVGYLENREDHIWLLEKKVEKGNASIQCVCDDAIDEAFLLAEIGFRMLERAYPEHVSTEFRGTDAIFER